jgi:enoyl-CoA hydratase/carnithine racemase
MRRALCSSWWAASVWVAGMELAMACDFIVASEDARFGQPEVKVGGFPPLAAILLPRLVPEKKALELILPENRLQPTKHSSWAW